MSDSKNLETILNGLIDVDSQIINKINNTINTINNEINDEINSVNNRINTEVNAINTTIARGSGTYAILDINTPDRGGTGTLATDALASHGKCIRITTSSSANYAPFTGTFSDVKFGHYAICARVKSNSLTSSNLVQLKVLNGSTEILAANFTGANFGSTSKYAYLYSTFVYEGNGSSKQNLSFQLHTHAVNGIQVDFDYVYISMIIPSVFI